MDIPPQLLFLHQGQKNMKELRFHPQYRELLLTTSEDQFSVFRPNLDPDFVEDEDHSDDYEEEKEEESGVRTIKEAEYEVDSDEDMEAEEKRIIRTANKLTRER